MNARDCLFSFSDCQESRFFDASKVKQLYVKGDTKVTMTQHTLTHQSATFLLTFWVCLCVIDPLGFPVSLSVLKKMLIKTKAFLSLNTNSDRCFTSQSGEESCVNGFPGGSNFHQKFLSSRSCSSTCFL